MDFEESIKYLDGFYKLKTKPGFERVQKLLQALGNPQDGQKYIHVAGTNGKGSTCKLLESILTKAGVKVGVFTSPYLTKINQEFRIGQDITDKQLAQCVTKVAQVLDKDKELKEQITRFEVLTVIAFLFFKDNCDIVVLETGLGGLYDSTNIIKDPLLTVITKISFDHQDYLGDNIQSIAANKAGIIKEGCSVVVAPQEYKDALQTIKMAVAQKDGYLVQVGIDYDIVAYSDNSFDYHGYKNLKSALKGRHQVDNAATAISCISMLSRYFNVQPEHIEDGLRDVSWPCRMERVLEYPMVYIDGAHNTDGVKSMVSYLQDFHPNRPFIFVFGVLEDKSYAEFIDIIKPIAQVVYTVTPNNVRALDSKKLAKAIKDKGIQSQSHDSLSSAIDVAVGKAKKEDIVVVFGSLYMVGYAREYILEKYSEKNN